MSLDESKAKVKNLQDEMKGMARYKREMGKFLMRNGYVPICKKTGHRVYWSKWSKVKSQQEQYGRDFWEEYKAVHKGTGDTVDLAAKQYMREKSEWLDRKVLNVPIQGGSAVVLKQAACDLFRWVMRNGLFGKVLFCVFAHDEICCECPEGMRDTFPKVLEKIMEKAAAKYYTKLPIPAECSTGDHWIH